MMILIEVRGSFPARGRPVTASSGDPHRVRSPGRFLKWNSDKGQRPIQNSGRQYGLQRVCGPGQRRRSPIEFIQGCFRDKILRAAVTLVIATWLETWLPFDAAYQ